MDVVEKFINQYVREIDFYERTARICAQICENELEKAGIRAIVTYRVKRVDRLKDKLIKRSQSKKYECVDDIYSDIVDLAGVRIALYFPSDKEKIERFIKSKFKVKEIKKFPQNSGNKISEGNSLGPKYQKMFSGYHATHYRINLKATQIEQDEAKYCQANVEIQVASVLMHAWSEVEHDLVYKPLNGELSIDEYEILDELNGLILAGELGLKRLYKAVKERVTQNEVAFSSHYELASFIYGRISSKNQVNDIEDIVMGRADLLFKFLKSAGLNTPKAIDKHIDNIDISCESNTVVEQIIDKMIENDMTLYKKFVKAKSELNRNPYSNSDEDESIIQSRKALFYFVDKWSDLQIVMRKLIEKFHPEFKNEKYLISVENIQKLLGEEFSSSTFRSIKKINTELIHKSGVPSDEVLVETGKKIDKLINKLLNKFDEEERTAIEQKINEIEIKVE